MLRYSLRTLLIVLTAACVCLAWAAFVRRMELFHRTEEDRIVARIVAAESGYWPKMTKSRDGFVRERIEWLITDGTQKKVAIHIWQRENDPGQAPVILNSRGFSTSGDGDVEDWRMAVYHQIWADKYRRAMFRPWELSEEKLPPSWYPPH